jgi:hypothetical protein
MAPVHSCPGDGYDASDLHSGVGLVHPGCGCTWELLLFKSGGPSDLTPVSAHGSSRGTYALASIYGGIDF